MIHSNLATITYKENNVQKTYDLTRHIPVGSYDVNMNEEFEEWTDSNYDIHRKLLRNRIEGTFGIKFNSIAEYESFLNILALAKITTGQNYIEMNMFVTNKGQTYTKKFYYEFSPKNDLPNMAHGNSEAFSFTIKEARA